MAKVVTKLRRNYFSFGRCNAHVLTLLLNINPRTGWAWDTEKFTSAAISHCCLIHLTPSYQAAGFAAAAAPPLKKKKTKPLGNCLPTIFLACSLWMKDKLWDMLGVIPVHFICPVLLKRTTRGRTEVRVRGLDHCLTIHFPWVRAGPSMEARRRQV